MSENAANRYALKSRITGFLTDLLLFGLLLLLGLAALNVLIQVIVLIVGIFQDPAPTGALMYDVSDAAQKVQTSRLAEDGFDLGMALVGAAVATFLYFGALRLRRRYLHLFGTSGFALFVSKRYLMAREGGRLVGLISIVSVLGVAVGTMALIVVISVMQGFDATLVDKFMGVFSHIQVKPDPRIFRDDDLIPEETATKLIAMLENKEFVIGVAPILDHQTIVMKELGSLEDFTFALFRGIDPVREPTVTEFMSYVEEGVAVPGDKEAVLGQELARKMGVVVGDTIYSVGKVVPTANATGIKKMSLKVVGIFHSGLYDVDDKFIYTNIATVQKMLVEPGKVGTIHMKVDKPDRVYDYALSIRNELPNGYGMLTWQMLNRQFFEALWIEKVAMAVILLLIVLVASFNIIGTLVMTVVQKTRDIGVLKSMGATRTSILQIFLYHGFLIGLIGTSMGVVWGLRICQFVANDIEKIFRLPGGVYGIDKLPVVIEPLLILSMALSALTICIVASIIPALQAAKLNPVEALRHE